MSKYIKLEDAISKIVNTPTKVITDDLTALVDRQHEIIDMLADLPTIEVSEDCISRDWVYNALTKVTAVTPTQIDMLSDFTDIIKNAPSVVPKDHSGEPTKMVGEWIADRKNQGGFTPGGNSVKSCSLCGWIYGAHRIVPDYNYCPNCGADNRPKLAGKHAAQIIIDEAVADVRDSEDERIEE